MMIIKLLLLAWFVRLTHGMKPENKCKTLYYGEMDKIKVNTQSFRTKYVMENFYKRRAKQSGMSVGFIKSCYESKKKVKKA